MVNIIAAIIFIVLSVLMVETSATVVRYNARNSTLSASVVQEAKELKQFTQAAYDYSESFGVPLSSTSLTVSNLQSYGLLPETFPQTTPFGQSFKAIYSTDVCNQDVMDLEVETSGNYVPDLLAKNGLSGNLGVLSLNAQVENELSNFNMSFVNAHNPCINGGPSFYIGQTQADSDILISYGGGTVSTSNTASSTGVAIYIYAPNQWGYLSFKFYDAIMQDFDFIIGDIGYLNANSALNLPSISSSGWSPSCPAGSTVISSGKTYSNVINQTYGTFLSQGYCIPAYKSQVNSVVINDPGQEEVLNLPLGESYFTEYSIGGSSPSTAYMYNMVSPYQTSTIQYLSPSAISGLNNNIYPSESYFQSYPPYTIIPSGQYPGANFISTEPLYNFFDVAALDVNVNGTIYQIAIWKYGIITGTGVTPAQAGMNQCNPEGTCFPSGATIWEDSNGINQGSSFDNSGGGYYITSNPSNPNSFAGNIEYVPYNGGPTYTASFSIPTPLIN